MIQRIQTVYLFLAVLLTTGTFFTPLFDRLIEDPAAWIFSAYMAASVFAMGLTAWSIFRFADRDAQVSTVNKAIVFQTITVGVGVAVFFTLGPIRMDEFGEFFAVGMLVLALILQVLGRAAILKDEKLVKSMDRIR